MTDEQKIEYNKLNAGERRLIDWRENRGGGFFHNLFEAIKVADAQNRARLKMVFPMEVKAFESYSYEIGWWENLCNRCGINY